MHLDVALACKLALLSSHLFSLFPCQLFLHLWVLAESAEEVAQHESGQQVEEEDLTHEPEIDVRDLKIAVKGLALEVGELGPNKNDAVKEH